EAEKCSAKRSDPVRRGYFSSSWNEWRFTRCSGGGTYPSYLGSRSSPHRRGAASALGAAPSAESEKSSVIKAINLPGNRHHTMDRCKYCSCGGDCFLGLRLSSPLEAR